MYINKPSKILYLLPSLITFALMMFSNASSSIFQIENIWLELFEGFGFYGAIGLGVYQYKKYSKDFEKFVIDIKRFGQKKNITDYKVITSRQENGTAVHRINAVANLNGKEQKITSRISTEILGVISKRGLLTVYYDPMNTEKFIYYVDLPKSKIPTIRDLYKLYKQSPHSIRIEKIK